MESATGICTYHVLSIANSQVALICKQWEWYRSCNIKHRGYRHVPEACTILTQARVTHLAFQEVIDCMKAVLGPLRMEHYQDELNK